MTADIMLRQRIKQELAHKNRQLKLLNDIVRHDIKNDVSIAEGYLTMLEEFIPSDSQQEFDRVKSPLSISR